MIKNGIWVYPVFGDKPMFQQSNLDFGTIGNRMSPVEMDIQPVKCVVLTKNMGLIEKDGGLTSQEIKIYQ